MLCASLEHAHHALSEHILLQDILLGFELFILYSLLIVVVVLILINASWLSLSLSKSLVEHLIQGVVGVALLFSLDWGTIEENSWSDVDLEVFPQ